MQRAKYSALYMYILQIFDLFDIFLTPNHKCTATKISYLNPSTLLIAFVDWESSYLPK